MATERCGRHHVPPYRTVRRCDLVGGPNALSTIFAFLELDWTGLLPRLSPSSPLHYKLCHTLLPAGRQGWACIRDPLVRSLKEWD